MVLESQEQRVKMCRPSELFRHQGKHYWSQKLRYRANIVSF